VTSAGRQPLPDLPIVEILDGLRAALDDRRRAVVAAPPGAGKTTVVPLALLDAPWLGDGRIVMLEPRRLATRAAARRMADLTGTAVKALGLSELPAFLLIRVDGTVAAAAEGWTAASWRAVADTITDLTAWRTPDIPVIGDPGPFHGSPALG